MFMTHSAETFQTLRWKFRAGGEPAKMQKSPGLIGVVMAGIMAIALSFHPAMAQWRDAGAPDGGWIKLADRQVGQGLETAEVEIGRAAGRFDRIRLSATGGDVIVHEIRAYFADGDMQRVSKQGQIPAQGQSEAYLLDGGGRWLERIELTFKGRGRLPALISVWGERGDEPSTRTARSEGRAELGWGEPGWELLGKDTVGPTVSSRVFAIGRSEGRFEALRLRVLRSDVAFHDIRVVYMNGETDTLAVRRMIRAGDASPPLALKGQSRFIREIELVHEANPNVQEPAVVQVWARRTER